MLFECETHRAEYILDFFLSLLHVLNFLEYIYSANTSSLENKYSSDMVALEM